MLRDYGWKVNYEFTDKALSIRMYLFKEKNNYKFFIAIGVDVNNTNLGSVLLWIDIALQPMKPALI